MAEKDPGLVKAFYNDVWKGLPKPAKVAVLGYVVLTSTLAALPFSNDKDANAIKRQITPWGQIDKSIAQKRVGYVLEPEYNGGMDGIDTDMNCYYDYNEPSLDGLRKDHDSFEASYVKENKPASWTMSGNSTVQVHSHINGERMDNTRFTIDEGGVVSVDQYQGVLGRPYPDEPKPQAEAYVVKPGQAYLANAGMVNYAIGRYSESDDYYTVSMWCNKPGTDVIMGGLNAQLDYYEQQDRFDPIDPFYPFGY